MAHAGVTADVTTDHRDDVARLLYPVEHWFPTTLAVRTPYSTRILRYSPLLTLIFTLSGTPRFFGLSQR
jgi:hypothetical protein